MVASEAGLAYGTFYRHFRDLAHVVRDAMVRETANLEKLNERFAEPIGDAAAERAKLVSWVRDAIAAVLLRPGLFRAWHVTSNHDWAVVAERQRRFEASVEHMSSYLERLRDAGTAKSTPGVRGVRDHRARRRGNARSGHRQDLFRSQARGHYLASSPILRVYSSNSIGWWRMSHSTSVAPNGENPAFA